MSQKYHMNEKMIQTVWDNNSRLLEWHKCFTFSYNDDKLVKRSFTKSMDTLKLAAIKSKSNIKVLFLVLTI